MARIRNKKTTPRPIAPPPRRLAEADRLPGPVAAVLWGTLAALVVVRALATLTPTMWAWSLNLNRFLAPTLGWGLWALAALVLVPPLARRAAPLWNAAGDAIAEHPALATWAGFVAAVLLVGLWPDRVRFVGDFLLRQGTVDVAEPPGPMFPQALPLDILLHYSVPRVLTDALSLDANGAARLLGMAEAGGLAALAIAFARTLSLEGGAAVAVVAVVFFGAYLGMFTGFSKAFSEMCLLVAAVGVFGLRTIREGRGLLPLGLALAIGVTLHRSALGLLPAVVFAWVVWLRVHGGAAAWKRPATVIALAVPLAGLVVMLPRIVAVVHRFDALHFDPRASGLSGGMVGAALGGPRSVDLVNLGLMLSPLALVLPPLGAVMARRWPPGAAREAVLLALLALPFLLVMPFLHPAQGLFRDWDDFAATGVAVSLVVAWTLAQALRLAPRHALAVAVTLAAMVPTCQWLAHNADLERGLQRVRAFMLEPPPRPPRERGTTWDYLGIRAFGFERWEEAAESFARAASTSPSPRILQEWALAETMRGRYRVAQRIYYRFLAKAPENPLGWLGLASVSLQMNDLAESRRAANQLLQLQPGNSDALHVLDQVRQLEANPPKPDTAGRR